uniref:Nucleotide-diphospho-sugar transferase domain-containing protein n=1 Tax=viral metagenome TaxID=1070528 RepID=A0A6C0DY73_9ZZZZ
MATTVVPKLLNLSAPTLRNLRTLVWLQKQSTMQSSKQSSTVNWSKWDAVVTSISAYNYWCQYNTKIVGIIITELTSATSLDELFKISKQVPMILISQTVLALKSEQYWSDNFDNVLNLDNILEHYPFINNPWEQTDNDAVAILGLLCRYNRIVDCNVSTKRLTDLSNITLSNGITPNETWMVTQFFKHSNSNRFNEIKECLAKNCANPHIDKIVLINEKDHTGEFNKLPGSKKIEQFISNQRLTYANFLQYVNEAVPNNVFIVLCNADIYFGDALLDLHKINMTDKMLALLRWDVPPSGLESDAKIFGPRADSQDTWIFLSDSIKARSWDYNKFNFQLGQAGCDNAFAGHILRQKFSISNPAVSFKTFHLHNTNIRNYDKKDYIRSDIYINIAPTFVIDTKQETTPPGKPNTISNELASFEVKSSSMSNEITYCTMLEKEGRYKWEPSVENHYFEAAIPVYKWNKACVTPNGLVYDPYHIYKGKHADNDRFNYWVNANVDILTPLQKRDKMFAIPFKNTDVFKHPDTYILQYVSRCARLLKMNPGTSFWIPKQFAEYIEYFDWGTEKLNGAYFDENTGVWADEVIGFLPEPAASELGQEDIAALRALYPSWIEKPVEKICVVVIGPNITEKFVDEQISKVLRGHSEEWSIRYVYESDYASYDSLIGASLCIFVGGQKANNFWAKLWALPKECCVIEFQQELLIDGEFQHLAHVAGFKSWVLLLSKGSAVDVQEQIMEQLEKWFKKNEDNIL